MVNLRPVLLFSGNPGFSAFYVPFAKALYSSVNRRFPVWIISHAGHVVAPKDKKIHAASDGMCLSTCAFLYSEGEPAKVKSYTSGDPCLRHWAQDAAFW